MKKFLLSVLFLSGVSCYAQEIEMNLQKIVVEPRELYVVEDRGFVLYTEDNTYVFKEIRFENGKFWAVY